MSLTGGDAQEFQEAVQECIVPFKDMLLARYVGIDLKTDLAFLKKKVETTTGHLLSRPRLCVIFLDEEIKDPLEKTAIRFLRAGNMENFILWYDVVLGFGTTLRGIVAAEEEITRGIDSHIVDYLKESPVQSETAADSVERFLKMKRDTQHFVELLKGDPTGMTLLREMVRRAGEESILVQEFARAGAELALEMYERVYPYSEF